MKRGFLLRDTIQSLPTCRLATQPPARMLATERNPKGQPTTEKLLAELLATKHPYGPSSMPWDAREHTHLQQTQTAPQQQALRADLHR